MEAMISFVDAYRDDHGVEPICKVLPIAPSTYHAHVARRAKPETAPARVKRDVVLSVEIKRVFDENFQVYGVRKVWRQLLREGHDVARCTVARLMKKMALQGVIRGGRVRTTVSDQGHALSARSRQSPVPGATAERAVGLGLHLRRDVDRLRLRRVRHRRLRPPHRRLARVTVGARRLRARRAGAGTARSQARLCGGLVHHSDRGVQYVSIKYTERLAEAGLVPSVGSVGDSYDNALAETINGLYKAEVIHRRGPWRSLEAVEYATLEWVDWFNNRRLLEPIGHVPPAEAEAAYYAALEEPAALAA